MKQLLIILFALIGYASYGQASNADAQARALAKANKAALDSAKASLSVKNDFVKKATFAEAKAAITVGKPATFRIANNELFNCPVQSPCPTSSTYDGANWYHSPALLQNN